MPDISPTSASIHVRKVVVFSTTAPGSVAVFTTTGRIRLDRITAFCTVALVEALATATVALGTASSTGGLIAATSVGTAFAANDWWVDTSPAEIGVAVFQITAAPRHWLADVSEDIIITVATQTVNSGTLVIDAWYQPSTDGAALAAA